ncbi:MAG: phenylalanine--tRNA ligase subunit alpha, partial [Gemmatimonadaceae bacterium]|nr:phenylalanine--tRNA ligase subunit alpha [Gemmatimonadaceae bacterium]
MTANDFLHAVATLEHEGAAAIAGAASPEALETARHELLGRKSGRLTELMKALPTL